MFSSRKMNSGKARSGSITQAGIFDIPTPFDVDFDMNDVGDDSDLEAELAAISGTAGNNIKIKPLSPPSDLVLPSNLGKALGDSSGYETNENDGINDDADENDVDLENDMELMSELEILTRKESECQNELPTTKTPSSTADPNTIQLLQQRLEMYKLAEANAKANEDSAKVRRLNRGLKTLTVLLKKANKGETINSDDIPPEVSVTHSRSAVSPESGQKTLESPQSAEDASSSSQIGNVDVPIRPEQTSTEQSSLLEKLRSRQHEYKMAALKSRREGDNDMMLEYFKVAKLFDGVIKICQEGQEVDLSDMPPPPEDYKEFIASMQKSGDEVAATPSPTSDSVGLQTPTTILEALQQRLAKYKSVEESAKLNGEASKARRFGRIVKQYEEAIKNHQSGRVVPYDELPVPPGFGPLPLENNASTTQTPEASTSTKPSASDSKTSTITTLPDSLPSSKQVSRLPQHPKRSNLADQQMKILQERQKEFKIAAVQAKKMGEIVQAKEYLKIYKGFDKLIEAASSGLPVDLSSLPVSPSQRENLEASFAFIDTDDLDNDDISDIQIRVEEQLAKQLMMCKNTRDHHKEMGDVAGMNRFENLALVVQKDLDLVRYSKRNNYALPKFHYEKRNFNIVHCNTDLADNEIEITIVRGLNYNVPNPKAVDTYVRVEFPLLNEQTFKGKTAVVKDTDNPEYDQRFSIEIQRGNRHFQRIFKRHSVKCEVYSRGGFLRSDTLIGTVMVKLQPLESKCDIHDTFNLMEGRKPVGGKLEIKLRVRHPILRKQIEHLEERWLVLDS